jgi:hypothetical protein
MLVQVGQFFGGLDIIHVLEVALGENQVDLFERSLGRLWVVDIDEGQEARVDDGEEEVCTPA